jgi:hypothetical protein
MFQQIVLSFNDFGQFAVDGLYFAATYKDDLMTNIQGSWNNFVQSGQFWALMIGAVVGYIFRSVTSY